ncbi:Protein YceI [Baekduia alba]|uniref:YceI family protein n=1 Tax=Baekduia alba TaxID=2997333 RepID=UPI0023406E42|nr:YceI family protein [Baekduia alba]WCB93446.1 Protein YceI [Baekduia alba]
MSTHATDQAGTPNIETTRWRIDPARSSVEFRTRMLLGWPVATGRFSRYQGTLDLTERPAIELTIETASLDTGNEKRDEHLRGADFFGAEAHPYVRFVSDSATLDGERLKVRGRLYARGSSMPLELDVTLRRDGDELEIEAVTDADHRQLGMTWNKLGTLRTPSRLRIQGRLVPDLD